jgi:hypothetical protein
MMSEATKRLEAELAAITNAIAAGQLEDAIRRRNVCRIDPVRFVGSVKGEF